MTEKHMIFGITQKIRLIRFGNKSYIEVPIEAKKKYRLKTGNFVYYRIGFYAE